MGFVDPNDHEAVALDTATKMGGAYLSELAAQEIDGKPVMVPLYTLPPARWSREQWRLLVETICAAYVYNLHDQQAQLTAALQKVTINPPLGAGAHPAMHNPTMAELNK